MPMTSDPARAEDLISPNDMSRNPPPRPPTKPVRTESRASGRRHRRSGRQLHAEHASTEIAELEVALRDGSVTFHDVARAWFGAHDRDLDSEARETYRAIFPQLLDKFATARGGIESDYFCEHIKVAAVLTDIDKAAGSSSGIKAQEDEGDGRRAMLEKRKHASASAIDIEPLLGDPNCWESKGLLSQALDLHYRALEFLRPAHRKVCLRRVFATITSLLGTLDNRAAQGSPDGVLKPSEAEQLTVELTNAELYFQKHAERRAQIAYGLGMLIGMVPLFAVLSAIAILADVSLREPILVSLFAGGVGAIVSVMTRMAQGKLMLEREIGQFTAGLLGAMRPLIGAVFGALLFVLIDGNVISIAPGGEDPTFVTYAGLAFLAGFSERVANSVIDTGETAATGPPQDPVLAPTAGPGSSGTVGPSQ
jgi:hypothetical protein